MYFSELFQSEKNQAAPVILAVCSNCRRVLMTSSLTDFGRSNSTMCRSSLKEINRSGKLSFVTGLKIRASKKGSSDYRLFILSFAYLLWAWNERDICLHSSRLQRRCWKRAPRHFHYQSRRNTCCYEKMSDIQWTPFWRREMAFC
jgi:hypothetical protein